MTPFVRADLVPLTEEHVAVAATAFGGNRELARKALEEEVAHTTYWINDLYQVAVHGSDAVAHLNIRRRDGKPIFRDWRHFQQIKNELVGPEYEGVELYPAESRKVDTSNKYHIYVVKDSTFRFPFGFETRDVAEGVSNLPGFRQRPGA